MTVQVPEELTFNGVRSEMRSIPVLPPLHPRIQEMPSIPSKDMDEAVLSSSACWRGYIGSWEIQEGKLFLRGLRGRYALLGEEPLWAEWYSGTLQFREADADGGRPEADCILDGEEREIVVRDGVVVATRAADVPASRSDEDARIFLQLEEFDGSDYDEF